MHTRSRASVRRVTVLIERRYLRPKVRLYARRIVRVGLAVLNVSEALIIDNIAPMSLIPYDRFGQIRCHNRFA